MKIKDLSPQELEKLKLQVEKEIEAAKQKKADEQEAYKALVSETVRECFPVLLEASESLARIKRDIYDRFDQVLKLKAEIYGVKEGQQSHNFIDSESQMRIILGHNTIDEYDDSADAGIAMVKEVLESLRVPGDANSNTSVNMNLTLLAKDKKGTLKPSRILTLRKHAIESGIDRFVEGVDIIMDAHRSVFTKQYIKAQRRDENNAWENIPLGMTEAE